jgi:AraC family transcriptional regulator
MQGPADSVVHERQAYWLDMCLTPRPRNARACYRDHWSPNRFERIGEIFLLPIGETVQARSDGGDPQTSVLCHLHPEPVRQWFDGDLEWTDRRLEATLDISETNIRSLLLRLATELRHPGFAHEALVELIAAQLAVELSRYCTNVNERAIAGGLAPWRLRVIDERLNDADKVPALAELAMLCGISVRQLTRAFRISRGRSIGAHIANARIERARSLLAAGDSVKATAYTLGFTSPSSFCFAFRRATGETPAMFRQRLVSAAVQH